MYPGIKQEEQGCVDGLLYYNICQEDLAKLHNFEGSEYKPIFVTVTTIKGITVQALAYLYVDPGNLTKQ